MRGGAADAPPFCSFHGGSGSRARRAPLRARCRACRPCTECAAEPAGCRIPTSACLMTMTLFPRRSKRSPHAARRTPQAPREFMCDEPRPRSRKRTRGQEGVAPAAADKPPAPEHRVAVVILRSEVPTHENTRHYFFARRRGHWRPVRAERAVLRRQQVNPFTVATVWRSEPTHDHEDAARVGARTYKTLAALSRDARVQSVDDVLPGGLHLDETHALGHIGAVDEVAAVGPRREMLAQAPPE